MLPLAVRLALGLVTTEDLIAEGHDPVEIFSLKAATPGYIRGHSTPMVLRAVDEETREVTYAATVQVVDRGGDLVQVQRRGQDMPGGRFDNFVRAGAPFLWAHNRWQDEPPIGQVVGFNRKRVDFGRGAGTFWTVLERVRYLPGDDMPLSVTAYRLAVEGVLNSVSIGFVPDPGGVDFVDDTKARDKLGLGPFGVHFTSWDQIELSQTPTPMNPLSVGVEAKAMTEREGEIRAGVDRLVARGAIPKSMGSDFIREALPLDRDARAAERIKGFLLVSETMGHPLTVPQDADDFVAGEVAGMLTWAGLETDDAATRSVDTEDHDVDAADAVVDNGAEPPDAPAAEADGAGGGAGAAGEGDPSAAGGHPVAGGEVDAGGDSDAGEARAAPGQTVVNQGGLSAPFQTATAGGPVDLNPTQLRSLAGVETPAEVTPQVLQRSLASLLGVEDRGVDVLDGVCRTIRRAGEAGSYGFTDDDREMLLRAYDTLCRAEDDFARLIDTVTGRQRTTGAAVDPASGSATVDRVEQALESIFSRVLRRMEERSPDGPVLGSPADNGGAASDLLAVADRAEGLLARSRAL